MPATPSGVAVLCKQWTNNGAFDANTHPTITEVQRMIDTVTALMDIALAQNGFLVRTQDLPDVPRLVFEAQIESLVADMVNFSNSSGRLTSQRIMERGKTIADIVREEAIGFVSQMVDALVRMGVPRAEANVQFSSVIVETNTPLSWP